MLAESHWHPVAALAVTVNVVVVEVALGVPAVTPAAVDVEFYSLVGECPLSPSRPFSFSFYTVVSQWWEYHEVTFLDFFRIDAQLGQGLRELLTPITRMCVLSDVCMCL